MSSLRVGSKVILAEEETGHQTTEEKRLWVEMTDQWWEPVLGDPAHWRTVEPCDDTCHHPVHAFGAPRRRHLESADWIITNGVPEKPQEADRG